MHVDHTFAALKLFEDWLQDRISEVHAIGIREENEAVEFKNVECVRKLLKREIDIRQHFGAISCVHAGRAQ